MVQTQIIEHVVPSVCHQKPKKPMKNVKTSKSSMQTITPTSHEATSCTKEKKPDEEHKESKEVKKKDHGTVKTISTAVEEIKRRRREERLAKEKQAEEEKERFVKEAAERRAAEREEIIKQARRLILYRKPLCRRINQGLVVSECLRELDAQIKFRETIKNVDREEEMAYIRSIKEDLIKYEEELKQKSEEDLNRRRNYAAELKRQIEENEKTMRMKETEEFEAGKQDQINTNKYLTEAKEYEMQRLLDKKQKLNQFFKDAIEEKKQFDLKLKHEDAFEDRAIEVYKKAKTRINKMHKQVALKEKKDRELKADMTAEKFREITQVREDVEEKSFKKALEEREAHFREKERIRKERELRLRKELHDLQMETVTAKSKLLREEKDLKTWELMQRFKRTEFDKETETEERKREWNKKMEYAKSLKKYISEKEAEREQDKLAEDKAMDQKEIIEKENQRVLNYAEEVLNESKGIRPLFPILKAVEECKKEMGLLPPKKKEEIAVDKERKRRRRIPRVCTKFVPEDKVCYLK